MSGRMLVCATVALAALSACSRPRSAQKLLAKGDLAFDALPAQVAAPAGIPIPLGEEERGWLSLDATEDFPTEALALPPRDVSAPRPVAVMLHGMCSTPLYDCPPFADAVTASAWLVCPRAAGPCADGGEGATWLWPFEDNLVSIESTVKRVAAMHPGEVDDSSGGILIGFSFGALAALELAQRSAGKYEALVLIGAEVYPDAKRLAEAGVKRVVMAAGELDMMRDHMDRAAQMLEEGGVQSLFFSLGDVGHVYPADMDARMTAAIAWATQREHD